MFQQIVINSPLEQFEVLSVAVIKVLDNFNLGFTNYGVYIGIVLGIIYVIHVIGDNNANIIPNEWSIAREESFKGIRDLVKAQIGVKGGIYFPFIYSLFFFILIANLNGNIPYGFTVTSSLILCLGLSFVLFIGITIIGLSIHGIHFFSFFIPNGTPLILVPLLCPIELISYVARAFSLGVRLLANISAGHMLMHILSDFLFKLFSKSFIISILTIVPFFIFIGIIGLEVAVSFIQSYVFCVLVSSYLKDSIELH